MYNVSFPNGDEATFDILDSGAWSITGKYASRTRSRVSIYSDAICSGLFTKEDADKARARLEEIASEEESWAYFAMNAVARNVKGVHFAHSGGPAGEDTIWDLAPNATAYLLGMEAE